jgi:hypothetical protein
MEDVMTKKLSRTNDWMERAFIDTRNPHKLVIVAKADCQPTHRELRAKLFTLAAEFERRTLDQYKWIIIVDGIAHYGQGRKAMSISIELSENGMDEFYAAEGLIQDIACELGSSTFIL